MKWLPKSPLDSSPLGRGTGRGCGYIGQHKPMAHEEERGCKNYIPYMYWWKNQKVDWIMRLIENEIFDPSGFLWSFILSWDDESLWREKVFFLLFFFWRKALGFIGSDKTRNKARQTSTRRRPTRLCWPCLCPDPFLCLLAAWWCCLSGACFLSFCWARSFSCAW